MQDMGDFEIRLGLQNTSPGVGALLLIERLLCDDDFGPGHA